MERNKSRLIIKRYQMEHLVPLALTFLSIYFWFGYFQQTLLFFSGLIINIIGLIIWWAGKISIGENWDAGYGEPRMRNLVTRGIYSRIRHPIYLGVNFTLIGLIFLHPKFWLIFIVTSIVFYFFRRMFIEDRYLTKRLGKKYGEYKKKTWF